MSDTYNVFIDTNIFDAIHYNFDSQLIKTLLRYISNGYVELYITDVIDGEIKKHIKRNIKETINTINKVLKKPLCGVFSDCESKFSGLSNLEIIKSSDTYNKLSALREKDLTDKLTQEALNAYQSFLGNANATIIKYEGSNISEIIKNYFEGNPPFENSKDKKGEFPDAFFVETIKEFSILNNNICIVSNDVGLRNALNNSEFNCFEDLRAFFDFVNINKELKPIIEKFLGEKSTVEKLQSFIENRIYEIDPYIDGCTYDRKGYCEGHEYDETQILEINNIGFELTSIDYADKEDAVITILITADIEAECTCFDAENSAWDNEDKQYFFKNYITVNESHEIRQSASLSLSLHFIDEQLISIELGELEIEEFSLDEDTRTAQDIVDQQLY